MPAENLTKKFVTNSTVLVGYQLTLCLPYVICSIFIGRLGSSLSLAAYGLTTTILNVGFHGILLGVQESLGVVCSRLYGAQMYRETWQYLWKSLLISFSLAALFHLFTLRSAELLMSIGIDMEVAMASQRLLKWSALSLYFQGAGQIASNFLSSQQITRPLLYLNFLSVALTYVLATFFFGLLGTDERGYAYTKICQEIFNMIYCMVVVMKHIDREYFEPPSIASIRNKLLDFLMLTGYTALAFYGEMIAFEINTYYAALLHNVDALAIWVTYINYTGLVYFASVGFGATVRNLVGSRIGERRIQEAKSESLLYFRLIGIFALVVIVLQLAYSENIARVFTKNEALVEGLQGNIKLYCISVFFTLITPGLNSLYRVVGKQTFMFYANVICYPLSTAIVNYFTCFVAGLGVLGINIGYIGCKVIVAIVLAIKLYWFIDWQYIEFNRDAMDSFHDSLIEKSMDESMVSVLSGKEMKTKALIDEN